MSGTAETSDLMQDDRLAVSQVEASRLFNVSERTVRRWEKRGDIKGKRVYGKKLYPLADIKRLTGVA